MNAVCGLWSCRLSAMPMPSFVVVSLLVVSRTAQNFRACGTHSVLLLKPPEPRSSLHLDPLDLDQISLFASTPPSSFSEAHCTRKLHQSGCFQKRSIGKSSVRLHAQNDHLRDNTRDPTPKDIQAHERKGAAFWCSAALYCPGPGFGVRVRLRRRGHQLKGAPKFFFESDVYLEDSH